MADADDSPATNGPCSDQQQEEEVAKKEAQHIILFYKYHPLSRAEERTEIYRAALEQLCRRLSLKGRILVGCSDSSEGINGTLAGAYDNVKAFTQALLGKEKCEDTNVDPAVEEFWTASQAFFESIEKPALAMDSPHDFKWSRTKTDSGQEAVLFPDLNIKLVKELIGTGGVLSNIELDETAQGYLTPRQWHDELTHLNKDDTILIDCRNTKECEIGRFEGALDPQTTTFAQFPKWVDDHKPLLQNKKVLMYCTGGIRCEKASAYVRRRVPSVQAVQHLKGGIHKYLEEVEGDESSHWQGKNFVFHSHVETTLGCQDSSKEENKITNPRKGTPTVGQCSYCSQPYDRFDPRCVCTVCREPLLACTACQETLSEFHCKQHFHLRNCYYTDLTPFSTSQLRDQLQELEMLAQKFAVGKRFKQKRKTLNKQCEKIRQRLQEMGEDDAIVPKATEARRCRNCNDPSCEGKCWGFLGLKRKEVLEQKQQAKEGAKYTIASMPKKAEKKKRNLKEQNKERVRQELEHLKLSQPASAFRDAVSGIRVPPPCTRILQTKMKGKWKGTPVLKVVRDEFGELAKPGVLDRVLEEGLLKINGAPVTMENGGVGLQTGDTISRIVRWHEPPVMVPEKLGIQKVPLPEAARKEYDVEEDAVLYVCNKPSTVPVHPAGPYLANSLTMMAEAQEGLPPQTLNPCHRTDRVTSGLTICCTSSKAASVVQKSMCEKQIQKLYMARVVGKFCASKAELELLSSVTNSNTELVKVAFLEASECVRVEAPIETVDPANGVRKITDKGKEASSLFRLLSYDPVSNLSILCCRPITGRSHQLRVHLQRLGHPIVGDVQYGGQDLPTNNAGSTAQAAVEALIKSATSDLPELRGQSVSAEDARAARKACTLCRPMEGDSDAACIAKSFYTPAQLLESGHAINLHASRYRIAVLPKTRKAESPKEPVGILELRVDNPEWSGISPKENVAWLEET